MGDVSGNWLNTGARIVVSGQWSEDGEEGGRAAVPLAGRDARVPDNAAEKGIGVGLPNVTAEVGKDIVVPVSVEGMANKGIISYEFDLRYDPSVITPAGEAIDVKGTASRGLFPLTNVVEPGLLRVVVYGPMPIGEDGVLLNLRFNAVGKQGASSALSFERIMFNEGEPRVATSDGRVELF